jgi:hypothetical protein
MGCLNVIEEVRGGLRKLQSGNFITCIVLRTISRLFSQGGCETRSKAGRRDPLLQATLLKTLKYIWRDTYDTYIVGSFHLEGENKYNNYQRFSLQRDSYKDSALFYVSNTRWACHSSRAV